MTDTICQMSHFLISFNGFWLLLMLFQTDHKIGVLQVSKIWSKIWFKAYIDICGSTSNCINLFINIFSCFICITYYIYILWYVQKYSDNYNGIVILHILFVYYVMFSLSNSMTVKGPHLFREKGHIAILLITFQYSLYVFQVTRSV